MKKITFLMALLCLSTSIAAQHDAKLTTKDLDFFIGEWKGEAVHYYPRDVSRETRTESVSAICDYILNQTYIKCETVWTTEGGKERKFLLHLNALEDTYQLLFMYDNWPRHVSYPLQYIAEKGIYMGESSFVGGDGIVGEERVEWLISEDKSEIVSKEYNHLSSDKEGYWAHYFKFRWKRVD